VSGISDSLEQISKVSLSWTLGTSEMHKQVFSVWEGNETFWTGGAHQFSKNCSFCLEIKQLPYGAIFPIAPTYLALPGEVWGTESQWPRRTWLKLE